MKTLREMINETAGGDDDTREIINNALNQGGKARAEGRHDRAAKFFKLAYKLTKDPIIRRWMWEEQRLAA